jgi:hypothetical protein
MVSNKKIIKYVLKYFIYTAIILALYVLQSTPGFLTFWGLRPLFLIPFCVCLAMISDDPLIFLPIALAGLLTDLGSMKVSGYFTLLIIVTSAAAMIAVKFFFKSTYKNSYFFSLVILIFILSWDFIFSYVLSGYKGLGTFYFKRVIIFSIYNSIFALPFYFLISHIENIKFLKISEK